MFNTIKLNKKYWQSILPKLRYGVPDPLDVHSADQHKFSEAMKVFNFRGVYKTTGSGRLRQTQLFLKDHIAALNEPASILDIGASDGSTSLDLINLLNGSFKKYYVTDYNIRCNYISYKGYTYFFNPQNECILAASRKFVIYPERKWLFGFLFNAKLAKIKGLPRTGLLLINRNLQEKQQENERIVIMPYNVFEPWALEKVNIVVAGNLLNRAYFTDGQIETALGNCYHALAENGLLAIIRNKLIPNGEEIEKSCVYQKQSNPAGFKKIHQVNEGVEIDALVLSLNYCNSTNQGRE